MLVEKLENTKLRNVALVTNYTDNNHNKNIK